MLSASPASFPKTTWFAEDGSCCFRKSPKLWALPSTGIDDIFLEMQVPRDTVPVFRPKRAQERDKRARKKIVEKRTHNVTCWWWYSFFCMRSIKTFFLDVPVVLELFCWIQYKGQWEDLRDILFCSCSWWFLWLCPPCSLSIQYCMSNVGFFRLRSPWRKASAIHTRVSVKKCMWEKKYKRWIFKEELESSQERLPLGQQGNLKS